MKVVPNALTLSEGDVQYVNRRAKLMRPDIPSRGTKGGAKIIRTGHDPKEVVDERRQAR